MENNKNQFPIVIKKKNITMIAAVAMEILVGINFCFLDPTKISAIVFFFVAGITAISVWDDSAEKIKLSEHKFELNKRADVLHSINYEKMSTVTIEEGVDKKHKKKNFLCITFLEHNKKKKKSADSKEKCLIDLSCYSIKDLKKIKEVISQHNPNVRFTKAFDEYINRK